MRRILVAVAATCLLVAGLSGPSTAITPLADMPRGADTVVPHLVYSTPPVIEAPGVAIPLPPEVTAGNTIFRLVGRTELGWVVSAQARDDFDGWLTNDELHLVTSSDSTELFAADLPVARDQSTHYRLSTSRKRVIRWVIGDGPWSFKIFDLSGNMVVEKPLGTETWVSDFTGTRVVYQPFTQGGGTRSWTIGQSSRKLTDRPTWFADIANNTLVVKYGDHYKAFATLTHPGQFRWKAYFFPEIISPDGSRVAGWADRNDNVIQVRRLSDGKLLTSLYVSNVNAVRMSPIRFEGNSAVVFQAGYGNGTGVLVRCNLAKVCARVSDAGPGIGFPLRPGSIGY
jgi:hypothetical protein